MIPRTTRNINRVEHVLPRYLQCHPRFMPLKGEGEAYSYVDHSNGLEFRLKTANIFLRRIDAENCLHREASNVTNQRQLEQAIHRES